MELLNYSKSKMLFFFFPLHWVFIAEHGLSLVAVRRRLIAVASPAGEHSLQSLVSIVVAHALSCLVACGIFPDQESNPCFLHWQTDS